MTKFNKSEVVNVALYLWNHVDQADYDKKIEDVLKSAPIEALKTFIEGLLGAEGSHEWERCCPDEDIVAKAKEIVRRVVI